MKMNRIGSMVILLIVASSVLLDNPLGNLDNRPSGFGGSGGDGHHGTVRHPPLAHRVSPRPRLSHSSKGRELLVCPGGDKCHDYLRKAEDGGTLGAVGKRHHGRIGHGCIVDRWAWVDDRPCHDGRTRLLGGLLQLLPPHS